jgi:hypothetical protein
VAEIRVVNSTGGSTPFSSDRLAGFLVRLGQPPADALDIAATVEGELSRNRVDEIKTEALRRVAVDLATTGRTRLAVERALVDLVPLDPAASTPLEPVEAPALPPSGAGPLGHVTMVHRFLFGIAGEADPAIGRFASVALTAAEGVAWSSFREALPDLIATLRDGELLSPARIELLSTRAGALIPIGAGGAKALGRLPGLYADVVGSPPASGRAPDDVPGRLHDALNAGLTTTRPPRAADLPPTFPPPPDWQPPITTTDQLPKGMTFVKTGGLERRQGGPLGPNWPLYCVVREEIRDDLEGMETGYLGAPSDALTTENWPSDDEVAISRGWKIDLATDLQPGGFVVLPLGYDCSFHEWRLLENDAAPGLFARLQKLRDKLGDQRERLKEQAKKAVTAGAATAGAAATALTGVPVPDFVGKLAGDLAAQLVGWLIDLAIELLDDVAPFPPLVLAHATTWIGDQRPLSVVMIAEKSSANGPATIKPLAREYPPGTMSSVGYRHKAELTARWWWGASTPSGPLPWRLVTGQKRATTPVVAWRAPGTGFGAIVREVNIDDDDAVYVVCVRADLRLVAEAALPPPT